MPKITLHRPHMLHTSTSRRQRIRMSRQRNTLPPRTLLPFIMSLYVRLRAPLRNGRVFPVSSPIFVIGRFPAFAKNSIRSIWSAPQSKSPQCRKWYLCPHLLLMCLWSSRSRCRSLLQWSRRSSLLHLLYLRFLRRLLLPPHRQRPRSLQWKHRVRLSSRKSPHSSKEST